MTIDEMQWTARQVGLTVEQQQLGYRLKDKAGRVIASQLPKAHIVPFLQAAFNYRAGPIVNDIDG